MALLGKDTQVRIQPMTAEVRFESSLTERLISLVPKTRGSWILGANLFRLLPKARWGRLVLEHGEYRIPMTLDLGDPPQFTMVRSNRFDLMTAAVIAASLNRGDVFVDVGANWGYFTCIGSHRVGPSGLVLAIEPNRVAGQKLLQSLRRERLVNVTAVQCAAYDTVGKPVSLVKPFFRQTTGTYVREGRLEGRFSAVTSTLDYMLSKTAAGPVRLIKVDTEGAELRVMKGAQGVLSEWKPLVILEVSKYAGRFGYSMRDLYEYMSGLGYSQRYSVQDVPGKWELSGPLAEVVEGQILFQHRDSVPQFFL